MKINFAKDLCDGVKYVFVKYIFGLCPFPDTQLLKSLESPVLSVSLYNSELTDGWQYLRSFRMRAGHQKDQGIIRELGFSALSPNFEGEEWG